MHLSLLLLLLLQLLLLLLLLLPLLLLHRAEKEVVEEPDAGPHRSVVSVLMKFHRYNVTVLCFTSASDGVESPIAEDVPGAIAGMDFISVLEQTSERSEGRERSHQTGASNE